MVKNKKIKKFIIFFGILIVNLIVITGFVSSGDWYSGELHVYTGFRGETGYDGLPSVPDNCGNGNAEGFNVSELKSQALARGIEWQGYADESFCLQSPEFNTVKTDCENAEDSSFTCLHGETLVVKDDSEAWYSEQYCLQCALPFFCTEIPINGYAELPPFRAGRIGTYGSSDYVGTSITDWCSNSLAPQDGIDDTNNYGGLSIIHSPFGEQLVASEGLWDFESRDYVSDYTGVEIWNAEWGNSTDENARSWWKEELLGGRKIYAFGGVGRHHPGNFFGTQNIVYLDSLNNSNLKTALKEGYSSVSNNGKMYIEVYDSYNNTWENMGETFNICEDDTINISVTYDVNNNCNLTIYKGVIGGSSESYWKKESVSGSGSEDIITLISDDSYLRAECISDDGNYRIYTNPIWTELSPDVDGDSYCTLSDCDDSDGSSYPGATEYCDGIDNNCDTSVDEGCEGSDPQGESYNCTESGYDQCSGYLYGSCNVSLAVNHYTNVNDIRWGAIGDESDPYVIGNYTFGWNLVNGLDAYYEVNNPGENGEDDCNYEDQCSGNGVLDESTMETIDTPNIAYRKNILGYNKVGSNSCWIWFNSFEPNYGENNPIYILNCFDEDDCPSGEYCDKTHVWDDWRCILKKEDGRSCTSSSECSSGYCDNDGIGLNDSDICFTPKDIYFDGENLKYCEYSTGYGDVDCDEKEIGNGCGSDCKWSVNAPSESTMIYPNGSETLSTNLITINWSFSTDLNNDFVRYSLQYSNDSGGNWTNIISELGYENKLNDSSTEKVNSFSVNENKTIYVRLLKNAKISYAKLDLEGLSS
ncbi:putative metal-binding motif-containing protein [Candidatus Pacearchaeota archaeon]|nr:putative metal-binding motif-containing protein [Candidatus Pacearchaeota archaeon]